MANHLKDCEVQPISALPDEVGEHAVHDWNGCVSVNTYHISKRHKIADFNDQCAYFCSLFIEGYSVRFSEKKNGFHKNAGGVHCKKILLIVLGGIDVGGI